MKLLPLFSIVLLFSICHNSYAQFIQEKHTPMCDHSMAEAGDDRSMINGFVTGWTNPHVIDLATSTPYHFIYVTDYADVDEITLDHSFISQHTLNGNPITTITLHDDGLGNDVVAGDNIFTSADVVYNNPNNYQTPVGLFMRFTDVTYLYNNGTTQTLSVDLGFGIRTLRSDLIDTNIPVNSLGADIQYSSHVVNIAVDLIGQSAFSSLQNHTQTYYNHFPDTKDFMKFATTYATPAGPAASYSRIQVEETGVIYNQSPFDNSAFYGSAGELNGVMRYYYTYGGAANLTNHELLHHWGTVLHPDLELTISGSHWSVVEFQESGFGSGFQRPEIIDNGGDCYDTSNIGYTSAYNGLELYLMGLASIDDINWPISTLVDWVWNGAPGCRYTSTVGIVDVAKADYEALMPPRVPAYTTAQKDFESALIVLSDRLLTPQEMTYYNWQMEQNEMLMGDPDRNTSWSSLNFNEATGGLGTLTTKLPCPSSSGGVQDLVITDNPILSGLYEATNSLTANTPTANNGDVHFKAGQIINMNQGFETSNTTDFIAEIEDCGL